MHPYLQVVFRGLKLLDSPYVSSANITEDNTEDCKDMAQGIFSLKESSVTSKPTRSRNTSNTIQPATIGPTDHDGDSSLGIDLAPQPASKMKHNLEKLCLFTIGYYPTEGENLTD